jgi:GT2 family glycosyltransferase
MRHIAGAPQPPDRAYDADVLILALDRPAETIEAIESALGQRGVSLHVTVIDQGSHPANLELLAEYVACRPDVTLAALGENLGVAAGRNRAAAIGHGRIIVGLDNDAAFDTPDTLATAVLALDADPTLAAIGFRIIVAATGKDDLLAWGYPRQLLPRAAEAFDTVTFVGAGHAIRRTAWDDGGGYDEALFFCWEEFDFCLRAIAKGWRVRYQGDIVVRHKACPERRLDWAGGRWFLFVRNRLYIARKQGIGWVALVPRITAYIAKGLLNGLGAQTLRAVAAAARMDSGGRPKARKRQVRIYLTHVDRAHRGGAWRRMRGEVLVRLPGRA